MYYEWLSYSHYHSALKLPFFHLCGEALMRTTLGYTIPQVFEMEKVLKIAVEKV